MQELFYIPTRVDQLKKESSIKQNDVNANKKEKLTNVTVSIIEKDPVNIKNVIDIENQTETIKNSTPDLVLPKVKDSAHKIVYNYYLPHMIFHPFHPPVMMPYSRPYHYHPLCFPYCKI